MSVLTVKRTFALDDYATLYFTVPQVCTGWVRAPLPLAGPVG